jgi:hypothetical protein
VTETPAKSRAPLVFALLGILAALAAGGAFAYREWWGRNDLGPEQTVDEFLTAVFAHDEARAGAVICESWDPAQAVRRTRSAIPVGANVSWDDIRLLSASEGRAVVSATIGLRPFSDEEISDSIPWTFNLVDESGWRVCEARPLN